MQIFQDNARTLSALYSNEHARNYRSASETIGGGKRNKARKLHYKIEIVF